MIILESRPIDGGRRQLWVQMHVPVFVAFCTYGAVDVTGHCLNVERELIYGYLTKVLDEIVSNHSHDIDLVASQSRSLLLEVISEEYPILNDPYRWGMFGSALFLLPKKKLDRIKQTGFQFECKIICHINPTPWWTRPGHILPDDELHFGGKQEELAL